MKINVKNLLGKTITYAYNDMGRTRTSKVVKVDPRFGVIELADGTGINIISHVGDKNNVHWKHDFYVSEDAQHFDEAAGEEYTIVTEKTTKSFAKSRAGLKMAYQLAAKSKIWVIYFVDAKGNKEIIDSSENT